MTKIYIYVLIGILVMGAYFAGGKIGREKCHAQFAEQNLESFNQIQNQLSQTKDKINAETFNTSIIDIRGRLHEKYTIHN